MEKILKDIINEEIEKKYNITLPEIKLTLPPKKELGDYAFSTFQVSAILKNNPISVSRELTELLSVRDGIERVKNDGPYINIKLKKETYARAFNSLYDTITRESGGYDIDIYNDFGKGKRIVVDYIGANVGKPLHIGHMCTPNVGQAMINVYKKLGFDVISDSHIGDWGIIFGKLILAYKMWGNREELEKDAVNYLFELYVKVGEYIGEVGVEGEQKARNEFKLLSKGDSESIKYWQEFTSYSIDSLRKELEVLNIRQDYDIGESFYEGIGLPKLQDYPDLEYDMKAIVEELIDKKIATRNKDNSVGVVFDEKSKIPSCVLQKRDGTHGYLASDLACVKYRMTNWNPNEIVYFVDVRQQLHLKQVFEISKKAGWLNSDTKLFHAYNGFISLKDGAMSTRTGKIIKLSELIAEAQKRAESIILEKRQDILETELKELARIIGIGAIKYGYLKKSRETDVIFDWDDFMTFEGNSGPYIQYSYVRAIRILENSGEDLDRTSNAIFEADEEVDLVRLILSYKSALIETYEKNMPHILCNYIYNLTKSFSSLYNNIRIIDEKDEDVRVLRLRLVAVYSIILKDSFSVLGIEMPNKM